MKPIILNLDTNIDTREYIEMMQGYDYTLECNIFSEGASLDLSAYAVSVEMVQGNKKAFIVQTENITIEGNKATVVLDKDFTNSFGDGGLQIVLTQNGRVNGSWLINCRIKISALARVTDTQSKVDIDTSLREAITEAIEVKNQTENLIATGGAATKGDIAEVNAQLEHNVHQTRLNSVVDFTKELLTNRTLKANSPQYGEIYNKMKYSEEWDNVWLSTEYANLKDTIIIDGIKLTKISTNNFYNEIITNSNGVGMDLEEDKKYLCSAYCYTKGKPFFFYHQYDNISDNHASYCDNTLRRFWFTIDGQKVVKWFVQGISGLNFLGTGYKTDLYIGGFQVETIANDTKNGIVVIGDSTVDGSSGSGTDIMQNTEWVKFLGTLLNVDYFNRGIGGNTTQQMIDRWATDITPLKSKCKYIIIQGGINDLTTKTALEIFNNHKIIHQKAITDGLIPLHCTITPNLGDNLKRIEVNNLLKAEYDDILDIGSLLEDIIDNSKLIQLDGWVGDGVHYDQKAKLYVANYIVQNYNWDFVIPKKYQKVNNFNYSLDINKTEFDIYKKGTNTVKCKIKDYYDGTMIELFDDNGVSSNINYKYGALNIEGQEINITPNTIANFNKKHKFNDELIIPNKAPTSLLLNQLYVKDGKLYITIDYVEHEIQLVN